MPARLLRVLLAVVASVLLGGTVLAAPALAHTGLESSNPADGTTLSEPLGRVELTFTKPIELLPDAITLAGEDGEAVTRRIEVARSADGLVVVGDLSEPLYAGRWRVQWRVLASDSHPREGAFVVEVAGDVLAPTPDPAAEATPRTGASDPPASASTEPPSAPRREPFPTSWTFEVLGDVLRALYYVGLMVAVGLALFKAGPHRGEEANAAGLARAVAVGAGLGLVGGVGEVVAHVGRLAANGWSGMFDGAVWSAVVRTGLGTALLLRVVGLTALLAAGVRRGRLRVASGPDPVKLVGALVVLLSFQFVGHTASTAPEWAIRTADLTHVVAAAVWVGGLVGLAMLSGHADRLGRARTAARFSTAAAVAVAVVAVAGSVLALLNLPGVGALFSTGYGRILVAKLVLVGVLATLGAHNHYRVVPRLTDGDTDALDDLRRTVAAEVVVVLVVIVLTALLVNTSPV